MIVTDILAQCATLGVPRAPGDAGTRRVSPPGVLPKGLRAQRRAHKTALLPLLVAPPAAVLSATHCPPCGSRARWRWRDGRLRCRVCFILDLASRPLRREGHQEPQRG